MTFFKKKKCDVQLYKKFNIWNKNIKSVYYGSETISFLGSKIWELLLSNIKDSENLKIFKSNIKSWKPENCPCRLCWLYIADITQWTFWYCKDIRATSHSISPWHSWYIVNETHDDVNFNLQYQSDIKILILDNQTFNVVMTSSR